MRPAVTPEAEQAIADIGQRYALSGDAVYAMLVAVNNGGGTMAQFSIPELGGSGQWMRGGMTMVGNMFDNALKARVDGLCRELSQLLATTPVFPPAAADSQRSGTQGGSPSNNWWPADLGSPSSSGAQNNARYAIFPNARRLAIQVDGVTRVFDTADHRIGGVQQQQGGPSGSVSFTSQFGTFDTSSLPEIGAQQQTRPTNPMPQSAPAAPPEPQGQPQSSGVPSDVEAIVAAIESLAGLHQRGILSDDEFATKKAELLGRL